MTRIMLYFLAGTAGTPELHWFRNRLGFVKQCWCGR